jgi:hypothetical protein
MVGYPGPGPATYGSDDLVLRVDLVDGFIPRAVDPFSVLTDKGLLVSNAYALDFTADNGGLTEPVATNGREWLVDFRPLLPVETSCADLA